MSELAKHKKPLAIQWLLKIWTNSLDKHSIPISNVFIVVVNLNFMFPVPKLKYKNLDSYRTCHFYLVLTKVKKSQ